MKSVSRRFASFSPPRVWPPSNGFWKDALINVEQNEELVWFKDEHVVVCYDKFPKARIHLLVVPFLPIQGLAQLSREHIPLLKMMDGLGKEISEQ